VTVFVDSDIRMYEAGREHRHRDPAHRFLEQVRYGAVDGCRPLRRLEPRFESPFLAGDDKRPLRRICRKGGSGMTPFLALLLLAQPAESFRRFTHDGAWCWIADPRALAQDGRTFAGWVTGHGDVVVASLDHGTGEVRSHVLHGRLDPDDHANPALIAQPDGRLLALYSKHADRVLRARMSARPGDVTEWEPERELRLNDPAERKFRHYDLVCYPNPSRAGDVLALFWRGTNWKPCLSFSRDGGATWSLGRVAFSEPGAPRTNRPYLKSACDDGRRIHLVLSTGHPRDEKRNSVF